MIFYFKRSSNEFDDILNDVSLEKYIDQKITWANHLLLKFNLDTPDEIKTYINIKYSDDLLDKSALVPDRTPRIYIDYLPEPSINNKTFRVIRRK